MSIPLIAKGIGELIDVSNSGGCLTMGPSFWHLLHFLANALASAIMVGQ